MLINGLEPRPTDRKKFSAIHRTQPPIVKPERPEAQRFAERGALAVDVAQGEIDEPEGEQAEDSEHRRVRMVERQERAVLAMIHQGRVSSFRRRTPRRPRNSRRPSQSHRRGPDDT